MFEMRAVGMTRDLRLLPRRQLAIDFAQQFRGFILEPRDVVIDVERRVVAHFAQFGNLPIERGDLFFEVQKGCHAESLGRRLRKVNARSEEHTSELQSLMRISYAVFCLKKK